MATVNPPKLVGEDRILLRNISWDFYAEFCEQVDGRSVRLSYDRGDLEIMVTNRPHEFYKTILAKLIELLVYELNIPIASGGSMTFQRKDLERGFEPDECWWIAHEEIIRGREEFDFQKDPPPDLAVEVEITSSLVSRVGIYAAMGVPEIWRFNGQTLRFCVLQDKEYVEADTSRTFPFLHPKDLSPYLHNEDNQNETNLMRSFGEWIRKHNF